MLGVKSKLMECEERCSEFCTGKKGDEYSTCMNECVRVCIASEEW
jgi:hypothetical protein